jgi:hypothetical protein
MVLILEFQPCKKSLLNQKSFDISTKIISKAFLLQWRGTEVALRKRLN